MAGGLIIKLNIFYRQTSRFVMKIIYQTEISNGVSR